MGKKGRNSGVSRGGQANLKPWKPGESGNVNGRPRGALSVTNRIRRVLKEADPTGKTWADKLAQALVELACQGCGPAIREVMCRIDGPVSASFDGDLELRIRMDI